MGVVVGTVLAQRTFQRLQLCHMGKWAIMRLCTQAPYLQNLHLNVMHASENLLIDGKMTVAAVLYDQMGNTEEPCLILGRQMLFCTYELAREGWSYIVVTADDVGPGHCLRIVGKIWGPGLQIVRLIGRGHLRNTGLYW